ncbi:MAG: TauD/TfdA family dioxygenase [Rhodocyclaceae bacterium]|nr:TauD/TfdA family dioxygenase [Rhodocyclaceae bacterium]
MPVVPTPFDLANGEAYRIWREAKLEAHPRSLSDLLVEVGDPRQLTSGEHQAIMARCRTANMAIYVGKYREEDKDIPRLMGKQFGLVHLDGNWLADEDGISSLEVAESAETRKDFIPYTNRAIRWHTDGYYNPPARRIWAMVLHCVRPAAQGGDNALMDHEMAYLLLRDENPEFIRALMAPDAMSIPARDDENGVARPTETGPVFLVDPATGALHMRYTARTRSIEWKADDATRAAVAALERLLASDSPFIFRGRLAPGMGLICNNVLHDRSGFSDDPAHPRLLYRARYLDWLDTRK